MSLHRETDKTRSRKRSDARDSLHAKRLGDKQIPLATYCPHPNPLPHSGRGSPLLLPNRRQVRTNAFPNLCRHAHTLAQRRMRVNGFGDVDGVCAHFYCEAHLTNLIARVGADDAATDDAVRFVIEDQLGEAFIATVSDGATAGGPGKFSD